MQCYYLVVTPSQFADLYAEIPEVEVIVRDDVMPLRGELGTVDGCVRIFYSGACMPVAAGGRV